MVENLLCLLKLLQVFRLNALKRLSTDKTNLKHGAHIHQPSAWPVPHTCAQPYHPDIGSLPHSRFKCRHATLFLTFFVSIPTGFTAEEPHNSFETTVKADFLNPRFFKIPDNSAAERNFPSPVDKHCNSDF